MCTFFLFLLLAGLTQLTLHGSEVRVAAGDSHARTAEARHQIERAAVTLTGLEAFAPQLIIGGEWTSTIKLTNLGTEAIPWSDAFFLDHNGDLMQARFQTTGGETVTGPGFQYSIAPAGIV